MEKVFYLSPSQKIHSKECRYCKPEKDGWILLESLAIAISKNYKTCRLCCPSTSEIPEVKLDSIISKIEDESLSQEQSQVKVATDREKAVEKDKDFNPQIELESQSEEKPLAETETKLEQDIKAKSSNDSQKENKSSSKKTKSKDKTKKDDKPQEKTEKKRYKILVGNGCHQAIAEVHAMLIRPSEENGKFKLILPDGVELDASFKNTRLKWLAFNNDAIIGLHWFRGYPKMCEGKLVCFQIIAWDGDMPTSDRGWELWEFTGLWTPQKNLTVQRSMGIKEIRSTAKETGFIKKFKYSFTNSRDFVSSRKLWMGYVYKLLCRREGDTLKIQKVIPFACPRNKPVPKGRGNFRDKGKTDFKNKNNS